MSSMAVNPRWTRASIRNLILELGRTPPGLTDGTPLKEALGDSLDAIEVALGLEERLGVDLSEADLAQTPTFGALLDLVAARAAKRG